MAEQGSEWVRTELSIMLPSGLGRVVSSLRESRMTAVSYEAWRARWLPELDPGIAPYVDALRAEGSKHSVRTTM